MITNVLDPKRISRDDWVRLAEECDQQGKFKPGLYHRRWEIELLFKRWKSIGKIAVLDGKDDVTKMCRFWARLCAAVVQHWLSVCVGWSATRTLSFAKLARVIAAIASELSSAIGSTDQLAAVIRKLTRQAITCCRRNKRRSPGAIELLRNPEMLDYALT